MQIHSFQKTQNNYMDFCSTLLIAILRTFGTWWIAVLVIFNSVSLDLQFPLFLDFLNFWCQRRLRTNSQITTRSFFQSTPGGRTTLPDTVAAAMHWMDHGQVEGRDCTCEVWAHQLEPRSNPSKCCFLRKTGIDCFYFLIKSGEVGVHCIFFRKFQEKI